MAALTIVQRMLHELRDLTIIGGGPTGIFALFYAGMRSATGRIVDALPELGGQLTALYPEKYIFDVAGFPKVLAKDLVRSLAEQVAQFNQPIHLGQRVVALEEADGQFVLVTETDRFPSRAIVIAAGIGAFSPRRLPQECAQRWYGNGIFDVVTDPEAFRGQRVVIIGGGDSAFDWGTQLLDRAEHVTIVHRSDQFRAHAATVDQYRAAVAAGRAALFTFHELHDIECTASPDRFTHIEIRDVKSKATRQVEADVVLPMLGFVSDLGPLAQWGLTLDKKREIVVNSQMETGRAGIYAAGDVTSYPGKLKLIATGFSEAAIAVNQAVHWIYPDKKVAPGHSSNMAIFGQSED
jgi:thioredoxin reductase (NADPH)